MNLMPDSIRFKEVFQLANGAVLGQIIQFLAFLIYPLFFSDVQFGEYAVFVSILFILGELNNLKLDQVLMLVDELERKKILKTTWFLNFFLALLTLLFSLLIFKWFPVFIWLAPIVFLFGIQLSGLAYLNKLGAYQTISNVKIIQALVTVFFTLLFGWFKWYDGMILGFMLGFFISDIYLIIKIRWKDIWATPVNILEIFKAYQPYMLSLTSSGFLNNISKNLSYVLLNVFFPTAWVGQFFFLFKIINAPVDIYNHTFSRIYFKEISDGAPIKKMSRQWVLFSGVVGIIGLALFWFLGMPLLEKFYFSRIDQVVVLVPIILLWEIVTLLVVPITPLLTYKKKLKTIFIYQLLFSLARIGVIILFGLYAGFTQTLFCFFVIGFVFNLFLFLYLMKIINDEN